MELPSVLRVASPTSERKSPFALENNKPLPPRPPSTSHDRIAKLFPSRPPSTHSSHHGAHGSHSYSSSSPQTSASTSAYKIPQAPALPSFGESTSYEPLRDPFDVHHPQPPSRPKRQISLREKLGISKSRTPRGSEYGILEDRDENGDARDGGKQSRQNLREIEEEDDDQGIGFDVSSFGGPIALSTLGPKQKRSERSKPSQDFNLTAAGLVAEYYDLEAHGQSGELGGGMRQVQTVADDQPESDPDANPKPPQVTEAQVRKKAQMEADSTGQMVAVSETPAIDVSSLAGNDFETSSVLTTGAAHKSYYFPPDPEQPSWRPISMHSWYISVLILLALGLAALQEFFCQWSLKKEREGSGILVFKKPQDLSMAEYFTWKYAPIMILVAYGILWQISDGEIKRLEPYYQLSRKSGATAAESLNIDYLTFLSYLIPFKAIRYRQWAVALSATSTLIAGGLVPVLQSASIVTFPELDERKEEDDKFVRIDPRWSRSVTGCLCFVAICGIALLFQLRRKSGLLCDPKGIAGIAAMATRSHILQDFQGLDVAPPHVIHNKLKHRRYILHKSSIWQGEYITHAQDYKERRVEDPRPIMMTLKAGVPYITYMVSLIFCIPVFVFYDKANKITQKLPWLLTALATIVKLLWGTLDLDVRLTEPFFILSKREAPASTLTLDYTGTTIGWLAFKALFNRHFLVAFVGLGAVMTEVLTVCASVFSVNGLSYIPGRGGADQNDGDEQRSRYNGEETFKSFWVSFILVIIILAYLIIVASLVYKFRRDKFLPRDPGTIASVLAFIHQSKMLKSFIDTESKDSRRMTRHLNSLGYTYGLGWFNGRDGEDHCGIDQEPLLANYKHGYDWTKSRLAGTHVGTWETY